MTEDIGALARAVCELCDTDGYRPNGRVCDHVDRREIAARGIRLCRELLNNRRQVKGNLL